MALPTVRSASTQKIYVVDDDEAVRESLRFLLEVLGFSVLTYPTGDALLRHGIADGDRGWLVLDYHMPELDGLALLARLRKAGVQWPAILITGALNAEIEKAAKAAGVIAILEKPVDHDALLGLLRQDGNAVPPT